MYMNCAYMNQKYLVKEINCHSYTCLDLVYIEYFGLISLTP